MGGGEMLTRSTFASLAHGRSAEIEVLLYNKLTLTVKQLRGHPLLSGHLTRSRN